MTELKELRARLLDIDERMLKLWKERDDAARRIGELKHQQGLPLQNFEVEKAVLEHALTLGISNGLNVERVRSMIRLLIESAISVQEREHVKRSQRGGQSALIVGGAGLMGGWFARFLEEQGFEVFVEDPRPSQYPPAPKDKKLDLILVATPPSTVPHVLKGAVKRAGPDTLIADISSIKANAVPVLRTLAADGHKVTSLHPMFGPGADVLMGRNVLILDCGRKDAVESAKTLFKNTAARIHELKVEEHDAYMAELLGLSHATSLVFNETLAQGELTFAKLEPLASTTFRKQVDVSREVSRENPKLYYEIQALNPESSQIFDRLEAAVKTLRGIVERRDERGFVDFVKRAKQFYEEGLPRSK